MTFWSRHPVRDDDLNAYVDGALSVAERARVEAHVSACASCREALAEVRALRDTLAALPKAQAPRAFALREADVATPSLAAQAGGLTRAMPLLSGVTAMAVLVFGALVGIDVAGPSGGSGADRQALQLEAAQDDVMLDDQPDAEATAADGVAPDVEATAANGATTDAEATAAKGVAPEEAGVASAPAETPAPNAADLAERMERSTDLFFGEEDQQGLLPDTGPAATPAAVEELAPGGGGGTRLRAAEAATAALALVAAGALAFVWLRRRSA